MLRSMTKRSFVSTFPPVFRTFKLCLTLNALCCQPDFKKFQQVYLIVYFCSVMGDWWVPNLSCQALDAVSACNSVL